MANLYLSPTYNVIMTAEVALAGLEGFIAILSIVATVLHYREAKKFNRIAMFHMRHCIFSMYVAILQGIHGFGLSVDTMFSDQLQRAGTIKLSSPYDLDLAANSPDFFGGDILLLCPLR